MDLSCWRERRLAAGFMVMGAELHITGGPRSCFVRGRLLADEIPTAPRTAAMDSVRDVLVRMGLPCYCLELSYSWNRRKAVLGPYGTARDPGADLRATAGALASSCADAVGFASSLAGSDRKSFQIEGPR